MAKYEFQNLNSQVTVRRLYFMYIWLKSQIQQSKQAKDISKFPINFPDHHEGFIEYKDRNINY